MKARDVMVRDVLTVKPETDVADAIKLLVEHDISALPVVAPDGRLVGILSEADLLARAESGHSWWVEALMPASKLAEEFAKVHGKKVFEVMSTKVISALVPASSVPTALAGLARNRLGLEL